jgi:hypothetical protein
MPIPEDDLYDPCPHEKPRVECEKQSCRDYLRAVEAEEYVAPDNSAEAWEEDWDSSPQLGGMGEELRQGDR